MNLGESTIKSKDFFMEYRREPIHLSNRQMSCTFTSFVKELLNNLRFNELSQLLENKYPRLLKEHPMIQLTIMNLNILSSVTRISSPCEFSVFKDSIRQLLSFLSDFLNFGEIRKYLMIILSTPSIIKSNYYKDKIEELKELLSTYFDHILNYHEDLINLEVTSPSLINDINKLALNETLCCMKMMWFPKEITSIYTKFLRYYQSQSKLNLDIMNCDYETFNNDLKLDNEYSLFDNYTSNIQTNDTLDPAAFSLFQSGINCGTDNPIRQTNERVCNISVKEEESDHHSNTSIHSNCKDKQSCQFQFISDIDDSVEQQKSIQCCIKNGPFVITRKSKKKYSASTKQFEKECSTSPNIKKKIKDFILTKGLCFDFTKRENIDKTVMRKFKRYLMLSKIQDNDSIPEFWRNFSQNSFIPPFSIGNLEFKSFCTNYMIWIFSHSGGKELYQGYIMNHLDSLVNCFKTKYQKIQEVELRRYLQQLGTIFSQEEFGLQVQMPGTNNLASHSNLMIPCPSNLNDFMLDVPIQN